MASLLQLLLGPLPVLLVPLLFAGGLGSAIAVLMGLVQAHRSATERWAITAQTSLPPAIRRQLTAEFPGWRFATLSAEFGTSLPAGASAGWVAADFNGDSVTDYAVQIVEGKTRDSTQRVFAFLRRGRQYRRVLLQAFPPSGIAYLQRAPLGEERPDFNADPNGGKQVRLEHDGVDLIFGEKGALTCLYGSAGFRCIISGD
jgi:hypothetical protein